MPALAVLQLVINDHWSRHHLIISQVMTVTSGDMVPVPKPATGPEPLVMTDKGGGG